MCRLACEDLEMLTDERYKQLMENVGMPNSRSLLQALKQAVMEATLKEREECSKHIEARRQELAKWQAIRSKIDADDSDPLQLTGVR